MKRRLLALVLLTLALPGAASFAAAEEATLSNRDLIVRENKKAGARDWQLTRVRLDESRGYRTSLIEGYCSGQSVAAGETLKIMVSTKPASKFKIEIFRTGYYGGAGARLMTTLGPFDGTPQETPPVGPKRVRECQWKPSAELAIPSDWLSGVYLGRLTTLPEAEDQPYWLEQHGYDVTYCSNADMLTPDRGLKCKAFISIGHDEYWDIREWNSVVKMRDEGVNLLFLSGNAVCWVSPMLPSSDGRPNRITFRGGPYGGDYKYAVAREKEHGPFPERGPDEGYLMGSRNISPVNGGGDWIITKPEHWIFEGTGVKKGEAIPGLVGWEYHGDPPADLEGLEVVAAGTAFQGGTVPQQWTATIYPGPKGNYVFNAATIFWAQDLSSPPGHWLPWSHWSRPHGPDARVQRITHNLLKHAIAP